MRASLQRGGRVAFQRAGAVALLVAALSAAPGRAELREFRTIDWRSGLPTSFTDQVEQDPRGFLWAVTTGGVVRLDGSETRRMAPAGTRFVRGSVALGSVLFLTRDTAGSSRLTGTDGRSIDVAELRDALVTADGALWLATGGGLLRQLGQQRMTVAAAGTLPARVWPAPGNGVFAADDDSVLRVSASGAVEIVAPLRGAHAVVAAPDGTVVVGCWLQDGGHVYAVRNGHVRPIEHSPGRLVSVARRDDVTWVAYDTRLVRLREGEPASEIGSAQGLPGGGPLLVDREGSLWVATARGLVQFPEPETVAWADRYPGAARAITPLPAGLWMSSWDGALRATRTGSRWDVERVPASHVNPACVASDGAVWVVALGFRRFSVSGARHTGGDGVPRVAWTCAEGSEGRRWIPTDAGLFLMVPDRAGPTLVAEAFQPRWRGTVLEALHEGRDGTLWGAATGTLCRAEARTAAVTGRAAWTCDDVPGLVLPSAIVSMPSGSLWVASLGSGVWRRRGERWEPLPAALRSVSPAVSQLRPSPAGGLWIVGESNFLRVEERSDAPDGWSVLERIGRWQGLPTSGVDDILEEPDGSLWLGTNMGLVRIPAAARRARPEPPPVALVETLIDGRVVQPPDADSTLEVPPHSDRVELRFAALSFREPGLIRYRARIGPRDAWSAPTPDSRFRFIGLSPGLHRVEVQASLDGERWTTAPASFAFQVLAPWWRSPWFLAVLLLGAAAIVFGAHRMRLVQMLRLERQRTRIAMDLHDAVGSGLGGVRILAGLAARPTTGESDRVAIAARIAAIAEDLASSLADIVWSLRPGATTLASLGEQLESRATPLFEGTTTALEVRRPDPWPDVRLSLAVRRHAFLIGLEAIHNAVRHAAPRRVVLTIEPTGHRWSLQVEDDGCGLGEAAGRAAAGHGLGLRSIVERARDIAATARWLPRPGGGTVFTLEFDPHAEDRRTLRPRASHDRASPQPPDAGRQSRDRGD